MGGGAWTTTSYCASVSTRGFASADAMTTANVQDVYREVRMNPMLDPKNKIRECCDSEEHPNTLPIILGLDVTGSMGSAATMCAGKLDEIMRELYGEVADVEFCMLGIGDMNYDTAPIQATQFESDIRIFDQTTQIYFEAGGGGNCYESYTGAWWFGLRHTKLDCWKRGKKGIIITMGDEPLNPVLYGRHLKKFFGDDAQDIETEDLYAKVCEKFDVYHIAITNESCYDYYVSEIKQSWGKLLKQRLFITTSDELPKVIKEIVRDHVNTNAPVVQTTEEGIIW